MRRLGKLPTCVYQWKRSGSYMRKLPLLITLIFAVMLSNGCTREKGKNCFAPSTCGGASPTPTPTPTPTSTPFPNDQHLAQTAPVKMGTSGGNATDTNGTFCCSGTLGSLI